MRHALLSPLLQRALPRSAGAALRGAAMSAAPPPPPRADNGRCSFSVMLLGDTMLGRLVDDRLRELQAKGAGPEAVWGDTLLLVRAADIRLLNLECALTDHAVR